MNPHAPTRALGRARDKIKIARFNVHDLRRACATHLGELGVAPHVISAVLNHVSTARASITQAVYNRHSYAAEKRDALEQWGKRLEGFLAAGVVVDVLSMKMHVAAGAWSRQRNNHAVRRKLGLGLADGMSYVCWLVAPGTAQADFSRRQFVTKNL